MDVACHFAEAMTLLQRLERNPVDPAHLAGANVEAVMQMNQVSDPYPFLSLDTEPGLHTSLSAHSYRARGASAADVYCSAYTQS